MMDLFWSKRGVVACDTHAPRLDSDEWRTQGWQQVPAWRGSINTKVLQCQFCHGKPYLPHGREIRAAQCLEAAAAGVSGAIAGDETVRQRPPAAPAE